jgi:hypothetical protein
MSWLLSLAVALVTGVVSLALAGLVADRSVGWYHVSSFEGAAGYYVVGIALLGGLAGFAIGLVVSRVVAARPRAGFVRALLASLGAATAIALAALGVAWLGGDQPPTLDGDDLALLVELRMPAGWTPPPAIAEHAGYSWLTRVGAGGRVGHSHAGGIEWAGVGEREGRWVVPVRHFVFTTTGARLVRVVLGDATVAEFAVPLPGRPGREHLAWSDWRTDGFVLDVERRPLYPGFAYRFRVEPWRLAGGP